MLTKFNQHMDDGDGKSIKQIKRKEKQNNAIQRCSIDAGVILQSIWIRYRSIFPTATDGKFMESELRFVLYSGFVFWGLYLLYHAIK